MYSSIANLKEFKLAWVSFLIGNKDKKLLEKALEVSKKYDKVPYGPNPIHIAAITRPLEWFKRAISIMISQFIRCPYVWGSLNWLSNKNA